MRVSTRTAGPMAAIAALLVALGFLAPPSALATVFETRSERDLYVEADLIMIGRVVDVSYRLSDRLEPADEALPHTFVTYEIEKLLHGRPESSDRFTLRFFGGAWGHRRVALPAGFPRFAVGDRDLVFVAGNGTRMCPLVGCAQGRWRIVDGHVLTDGGRELLTTREGALVIGERRPGERIDTHTIAGMKLRWRRGDPPATPVREDGREAGREDGKSGAEAEVPERLPLRPAALEKHVRQGLARWRPDSAFQAVARSVSIRNVFTGPRLTPVPPPPDPSPPASGGAIK